MILSFIKRMTDKKHDLFGQPQVTIAFIGDSVTQGCFELVKTSEEGFSTSFDPENVYCTKLKKLINRFYPEVFLNIINAGISGEGAAKGASRLERDVLAYHPDLLVVAYGLNDCGGGEDGLVRYQENIADIVRRAKAAGTEVIFMSGNHMNRYVDARIDQQKQKEYAVHFAAVQNAGWVRRYFEAGMEAAQAEGAYICDCNRRWDQLAEAGVDTTALLANHLNHPTRDLHWLYAVSLFETIFF